MIIPACRKEKVILVELMKYKTGNTTNPCIRVLVMKFGGSICSGLMNRAVMLMSVNYVRISFNMVMGNYAVAKNHQPA